ncbi:pyridine nucleotide-disulfide oxidoreductase [Pseudactinotalea sp. HY160]|uniref:dihydrolipoyl dehydrogenase family protein n=1 Tax=Pseudactinotalea sp. HY160 TaxID=2654490 RepID=UPI00128D6C62|nr:NAD(P)/FAD-dependent oxidoreductase [Pseudactinotalea sp. HY160]MPV49625.1 pyridine nucleotide-disulfide oxidoreductase [Pseudactinotalea sp. HY160]
MTRIDSQQGERTYDVVVIGAGPVGENVADRVVAGGLNAVVVEHELVGGECSYWACVPSKALLRPGAALRAARAVGGSREAVTAGVDARATLARRTEFTSDWDDSAQVDWLRGAGIDLVRGTARLSGPRRVSVRTTQGPVALEARLAVVVCTGSRAIVPGIPGLAEARPWTSREATSARAVPGSLIVLGGGVVGCESACAYADLGADVTVIEADRLLGTLEPVAAEHVRSALAARGVRFHTGATATRVTRDDAAAPDARVTVELSGGERVTGAEILVATGRGPRTDGLGLAVVGLTDGAWLAVDETLRVTGPDGAGIDWLYAAGDVNGRRLLTHQGKYQARIAAGAIMARAARADSGGHGARLDDSPWGAHAATADQRAATAVVFTDPQVASVGLTEADCREQGVRTRVVDVDLGAVAGAALMADGYRGAARMVVDADRQVILGLTFMGQDVAELAQAGAIAIAGEVPIARLWHAVPAFPTVSEVWLRLLEAYRDGS